MDVHVRYTEYMMMVMMVALHEHSHQSSHPRLLLLAERGSVAWVDKNDDVTYMML